MTILEKAGFAFAWIGVTFSSISLFLLLLKAHQQLKKLNQDENHQNNNLKRNTIILLIFAFGCAGFTLIYCSFYGSFGIMPNELNIPITQDICQYTAQWMGNAGWQLSRYCFYNFMLWRVRVSFHEPLSMRLGKYTFYTYTVLIHLWLILALCIIIFWTKRTVTPSGECSPVITEIYDGFTASDIRTVLWIYDCILTTLLLFLFIKRLFQLTNHNERVNVFRKKTVILSIVVLVTSIIMPILRHFIESREWRYFISLDLIINLICVVFTFRHKLQWNPSECHQCECCCYRRRRSRTDSHHMEDGLEREFKEIEQESQSFQPEDDEVLDMLARSQHVDICEGNTQFMDMYIEKLKEVDGVNDNDTCINDEVEMSNMGQ